MDCHYKYEKRDFFKEIMLHLPNNISNKNSQYSLNDLLETYFKTETIEDFSCEGCKKKTKYLKTTKISKSPKILIFVFNIFNVYESEIIQKIKKDVNVPLYSLKLNRFHEYETSNKQAYNLNSFICHYGNSVDFGHYIR